MKKSDLKDGICVISKNGATAYVIGDLLYYKDDKCEVGKRLGRIDALKDYTDDLKAKVVSEYDIVKVTYMDEIIWEHKEYITFLEAINSGKKFKHDSWLYFYSLSDALAILADMCLTHGNKTASEMIDEKMWEVV